MDKIIKANPDKYFKNQKKKTEHKNNSSYLFLSEKEEELKYYIKLFEEKGIQLIEVSKNL